MRKVNRGFVCQVFRLTRNLVCINKTYWVEKIRKGNIRSFTRKYSGLHGCPRFRPNVFATSVICHRCSFCSTITSSLSILFNSSVTFSGTLLEVLTIRVTLFLIIIHYNNHQVSNLTLEQLRVVIEFNSL